MAAKPVAPLAASARAGDHQAIHRLLLGAFHGPTPGEFHAQLDEPGYDPADRLVVRFGEWVAAHVRSSRRVVHLDGVTASAVQLMDVATAPEFRGLGLASELIAAAERRARERGVLLGLTRTRAATLFARQGWAVCGRHVFSTAGARQILAQLQATAEGVPSSNGNGAAACLLSAQPQKIAVRPLRRIELPSVMRLYEGWLPRRWGAPVRTEEYWDWLLNRGACDRAYVVAEGSDSGDLNEQLAAIRGYAFLRDSRIVELVVEPGRADLAEHLVARACADASEQDQWQLRLDAAPDDALHGLFHAAGGRVYQAEEMGGEVFMAKVLDPLRMLTALAQVLAARHRASGLARPLQLGLELLGGAKRRRTHAVDVARFQLIFPGRGIRLVKGPLGRHFVSLRRRDLTPLLLGHWHLPDLIEAGRMEASSKMASEIARLLFPKLPWWRPPLDDLLSC